VPVAVEVANQLNLDLSLVFSIKLPYPDDDQTSFGAVAENGNIFIHSYAYRWFSESTIHEIIDNKKQDIRNRINVLRNGMPLPQIKNKNVIIIDDGISRGASVYSVVKLCQNFLAKKIIIAVPVAPREINDLISRKVDKLIVLEKPLTFTSISQVYSNWEEVTEPDVIKMMEPFDQKKGLEITQKKEVA